MPTLLVPDSLAWTLPDLPLDVVRFGPGAPVPPDADALVVWGLGANRLAPLLGELPRLRWVQTFSAGVNHVLVPELAPDVVLSNGRGIHDAPVVEHAVAMLLAGVRGLHRLRDAQRERAWSANPHWSLKPGDARPDALETLEGARVLVLGMGSIGLGIARALVEFGARVEGVARTAGGRGGFRTHALEDLDELLPAADALVMVLPETPATVGLLSRDRLALLPARAWVVNVGRGSAVDERALADALEAGELGGAALDVFATEPLPPDSRLWTLENAIVSPHQAGGGPHFERRALELLARNAGRFVRGEPLENVVDRERGY